MNILKSVSILALSFCSTLALASGKYESGSYNIDPAHSSVGFEIPHLVISSVDGKFTSYEGTIDLNDKIEKSKVNVVIDVKSIDTGNAKRDDHLRSADFFEIAKTPKMTFKSTSVSGSLNDLQIIGDLTIKGVTKKVTLKGKYLGSVADGFGNQKIAFNAKTEINRKDFGLTWSNMVEAGPVVGDQVTIELKIQAAKVKKQAAK